MNRGKTRTVKTFLGDRVLMYAAIPRVACGGRVQRLLWLASEHRLCGWRSGRRRVAKICKPDIYSGLGGWPRWNGVGYRVFRVLVNPDIVTDFRLQLHELGGFIV